MSATDPLTFAAVAAILGAVATAACFASARKALSVLASVRIQAQFDILDEDGMIIAINTARNAPSSVDPMHRFELTTCYRLADGASGVVRSLV